jgi:addiction module RelB/DinJ family antitoxin
MTTTRLTVRMDLELKAQFVAVAESLGLDAPTVMRMFATQPVRTRTIALSLTAPDPAEQADLAWLDEARADWGAWRTSSETSSVPPVGLTPPNHDLS